MDVQGGSKANGAKVIQWDCNSRRSQTFYVKIALTGYVSLRPLHASRKCLDIEGASRQNNARLIQWKCNGDSNQKFQMIPA